MEIQLELEIDHNDSLDHWAALLADREVGSRTYDSDWQMHYVVVDLKTEHVGHSIRPFLYVGAQRGIYHFDEFEYKEIEIEDGMKWLQSAPERIRRHRMARFAITFRDTDDWPIDYGTAKLELKRHSFPLGVSLRTRRGLSGAAVFYGATSGLAAAAGALSPPSRLAATQQATSRADDAVESGVVPSVAPTPCPAGVARWLTPTGAVPTAAAAPGS